MYYILNFDNHAFISCSDAAAVEARLRTLIASGCDSKSLEIVNGFGDQSRQTVEEFRNQCAQWGLQESVLNLKPYRVAITETYEREVDIYARSETAAQEQAEELCNDGTIDLDFEDFVARKTECRGVARENDLALHEVFKNGEPVKGVGKLSIDAQILSASGRLDSLDNGTREKRVAINRDKLSEYVNNAMIMEFNSPEECRQYFNTYDGQSLSSVDEMMSFQGKYGFGQNGKWYHISFDEALDVYDPKGKETFPER